MDGSFFFELRYVVFRPFKPSEQDRTIYQGAGQEVFHERKPLCIALDQSVNVPAQWLHRAKVCASSDPYHQVGQQPMGESCHYRSDQHVLNLTLLNIHLPSKTISRKIA